MPPVGIPAAFWRGGTSRGLLFRAEHLAAFSPAARNRIILAALGSPDPDGRQVGGLGGGVSSLSKAAIVSVPGEARVDQARVGPLPGVAWADDGERDGQQWDIVYRFAQVGVRTPDLDWSASCGNMFAAACLSSLALVPYTTLFDRARTLPRPAFGNPLLLPLSVLSASNGVLMRARVPVDPYSLQVWEHAPGEGVAIAGVPGCDEPGIEVEMPLKQGESGARARGGLVTGNARDVVRLDDSSEVTVSVFTSGLPNIFVPLSSLLALDGHSFPADLLTLPASTLSSLPTLAPLLERIRTTAAAHFSLPCSLASPKITLVAPFPSSSSSATSTPSNDGYTTSSGVRVAPQDADLLVRAVSSGDWHASVPGTTLGALNIAAGVEGSVVRDAMRAGAGAGAAQSLGEGGARDEVVRVRAAHAAGVTESSVRFDAEGQAQSVVMVRTAREIMRGEVLVPERLLYDE
ncbi:hypothetical protein JCM3775_007403 [Rhodotorula graminis]